MTNHQVLLCCINVRLECVCAGGVFTVTRWERLDSMEAKWSNNTRNSFDEKCLLMAGTTTGRRGGS